ncbi:KOW motif-containing protein [Roseateles microcysteis]|uniref:KOW motif-containing protein n=1 Tax=Roseateles microcysteis TaxID=3119057 RepID=UPI002FE6B406
MQKFRPHEAVKVRSGKYQGLVGTVVDVRPSSVQVHIAGVVDGESIDAQPWLKPAQLEHAPL